MATTQYSVRTVKQFTYRNVAAQRWSNRYFFDGGAPADTTAWTDLMDAVVAAEKLIHRSNQTIIQAVGYGPTSAVPLATKAYTQAGTMTLSSGAFTPGDCAAVLRMATTKRSTKNHPVYCFSFFHGANYTSTDSTGDVLHATQKTAIETYGTAWQNGIVAGARTYKRTTPDGHATTGRLCETYISHRDFPR